MNMYHHRLQNCYIVKDKNNIKEKSTGKLPVLFRSSNLKYIAILPTTLYTITYRK